MVAMCRFVIRLKFCAFTYLGAIQYESVHLTRDECSELIELTSKTDYEKLSFIDWNNFDSSEPERKKRFMNSKETMADKLVNAIGTRYARLVTSLNLKTLSSTTQQEQASPFLSDHEENSVKCLILSVYAYHYVKKMPNLIKSTTLKQIGTSKDLMGAKFTRAGLSKILATQIGTHAAVLNWKHQNIVNWNLRQEMNVLGFDRNITYLLRTKLDGIYYLLLLKI